MSGNWEMRAATLEVAQEKDAVLVSGQLLIWLLVKLQ